MSGPLAGYRILDLTSVVMGPYATQTLGDMGADVVKVEAPAGDLTRNIGPARHPGMASLFLNCNRNKRSLVLDLKMQGGCAALLKLAGTADVLIHSMRPQAMRRLGFAYDAVAAVNPGIVYCACYGFGETGPYAGRPAFDDVIQGASGASAILGYMTSEPRHVPMLLADKSTGLAVVYAVTMALLHRERTGRGQEVDVSMFEHMVHFNLVEHLFGATFQPPVGDYGYTRLQAPDRRPLAVRDGYVGVMPYTEAHWRRFFAAVGRPELAEDERVRDPARRSQCIAELYALVAELVSDWKRDDLLATLVAADVPCAPINRLPELQDDPHLKAVGFFKAVEHPSEGPLTATDIPVRFSDSPGEFRRHAPRLGENSREILREAGLTEEEIAAMLRDGVTAEPSP